MKRQCFITLIDEVNCRVTEIDPATIRKCISALKFVLPHARFTPAYKLGRWDGTKTFFSAGGQTQIGMLDRILPILEEANYNIELIDNRLEFNINLEPVTDQFLANKNWPAGHPTHANQPIILREHQLEIVNNFLVNPKGVQVAPTSAGKTIICAALSKAVQHLGRTITIVPNKQLVGQTNEDYELIGLDSGVFFGDQKDWGKRHTVCTWQSLESLFKSTSKDFDSERTIWQMAEDVVAIIVDETHLAEADCLRNMLTKVFPNAPIRWGLTGTMPKEEYKALSITGSIGPVINTLRAVDLQKQGVLSNCEIQIIQIQDDRKFKNYHEEHDYLVNNPEKLEILGRFISNVGETGNTLALLKNVPSGKKLAKLITDSVFISGGVKVADRNTEYKEIATEDNKVIIATYGVASTGINVPRIFNMVLIEPGKSFIRTIQSIGRGLRRAHDKDHVIIYDICSSTKYSKKHLTERKKYYKEMGYPFHIIKVDIRDL